jgi:hypothetical protein
MVPVLSAHRTLMLPSVSRVDRLLHNTFLLFNFIAAKVNETVTVIGRPERLKVSLEGVPSGINATLTDTIATIRPDVDRNSG